MSDTKKILVVDDTIGIRTFLKISLRNYEYDVTEAIDGLSAIKEFETQKFDLVILDLGLPDIDGMEVLQRIRENNQETPVIILTVRSEEESVKTAYKLGANAYITKPFQVDEVLDTIQDLKV